MIRDASDHLTEQKKYRSADGRIRLRYVLRCDPDREVAPNAPVGSYETVTCEPCRESERGLRKLLGVPGT